MSKPSSMNTETTMPMLKASAMWLSDDGTIVDSNRSSGEDQSATTQCIVENFGTGRKVDAMHKQGNKTVGFWAWIATLLWCLGVVTVHADALQPKSATPGDYNFTIRVGELDRRYTVHVPSGYDSKTSIPVVIMLHGGGGTSKAAAFETGWGTKSVEAGFLAVFPDAMSPDSTRPSHFIRNPQLWNDGSDRFHIGKTVPDDVGFLNMMFDELLAKFTVDQRRIFVTGFSNGASMSFRIGAELSGRIAAIAPVAGALWLEPLTLERPVPMLYITGTEDPLNRIEGGAPRLASGASDRVRAKPKPPVRDSIQKWRLALGCPPTPRDTSEANGVRTEIWAPCREDAEVAYTTAQGLGHTWAGGKSLLPESMVGKRSDRIMATDVIWGFFQKHPKQ